MQKQIKLKAWIFTLLPIVLSGCYYDKEELLYPRSNVNCSTINSRFTDVSIIISAKCATAGCHTAAVAAGSTTLETYDEIRLKGNRINQRVIVERSMPPGSPLSAAEIATLKCWISSGMPNN